MITKTRCPHTGVVNFFTAADPLLAVGSVSERPASARFAWHCYLDAPASGFAADIDIAEARLRNAIAARRQSGRLDPWERVGAADAGA